MGRAARLRGSRRDRPKSSGAAEKIAWRRAADAAKRHRPETIDPASSVLAAVADGDALPDELAYLRLEADALRLVVESLDEQQAAVLKLRARIVRLIARSRLS